MSKATRGPRSIEVRVAGALDALLELWAADDPAAGDACAVDRAASRSRAASWAHLPLLDCVSGNANAASKSVRARSISPLRSKASPLFVKAARYLGSSRMTS